MSLRVAVETFRLQRLFHLLDQIGELHIGDGLAVVRSTRIPHRQA